MPEEILLETNVMNYFLFPYPLAPSPKCGKGKMTEIWKIWDEKHPKPSRFPVSTPHLAGKIISVV